MAKVLQITQILYKIKKFINTGYFYHELCDFIINQETAHYKEIHIQHVGGWLALIKI